MKTIGRDIVEEFQYGVYIWRDANGRAVVDSEYNYMCIPSRKGDRRKIEMLAEAAKSYGVNGGHAEFHSGSRPITHEQWEEQMERQANGEVPDPYDLGNLIDEYKYQQQVENG